MSTIQFTDGAAYERYMGKWSQLAGNAFLDWLAPPADLRWLDVGCGNGAFTQLIVDRCAPQFVTGVDPAEAQIAHARRRFSPDVAEFHQGNAMALPFAEHSFDAAVMPLAIFFVPDPARGVAEMARVVHAGGIAGAYAWDMEGGGFPYQILQDELAAMGKTVPQTPRPEASRLDVMTDLWAGAGLRSIDTHVITVERTFTDFDDYWTTILGSASSGPTLKAMTGAELEQLKSKLRQRFPAESDGRIVYSARAHAVKGVV